MSKRTILIQLDTDSQPSTFDAAVAVDAGVDVLLRHGDVNTANVRDLVYGAMFTRGPEDLKSTAIFVGGSDVASGEDVFKKVNKTFFGPVRVSTMLDSNGSNTTAAAAVLAVVKHVPLEDKSPLVTVLGGTGPVGVRVARLLAGLGYNVRLCSRDQQRAAVAVAQIQEQVSSGNVQPVEAGSDEEIAAALQSAAVVVSAGAISVQLASESTLSQAADLQLAIDLNAAPPAGLEGIDPQDKAAERHGKLCYGALGVGGAKMKIHKACLNKLFQQNDLTLDAEAILAVGQELGL